MKHTGFTKVPDVILDSWMARLSGAELKIILTIIRQTIGWNKDIDRISHSQFIKKTGLSQRAITQAIQSLEKQNLIHITDPFGKPLSPPQRRYRTEIYYKTLDFTKAKSTITKAQNNHIQRQKVPLTIYSNNRQQETDLSSFKKQSDQERMDCLLKRSRNLSCSCVRCL